MDELKKGIDSMVNAAQNDKADVKPTPAPKKKTLTLESAIKGADDKVLDETFGKGTPERKLAGVIQKGNSSPKGQLNFPQTKKPTQSQLNKEVTSMFKNRDEAMKWLDAPEQKNLSPEDRTHIQGRIDKAFSKQREKIPTGRDKELNDMIAALDNARSVDEAYDIEQGIIQLEDQLARDRKGNVNSNPQPKTKSSTAFLSDAHLNDLWEKYDGDEDLILDDIRRDPNYPRDLSNSDMQGIVEAYASNRSKPGFVNDPTSNMNREDYIEYLQNVKRWSPEAAKFQADLFYGSSKEKPTVDELTDDELYEELMDNEYWYGNAKNVNQVADTMSKRLKISPERALEFAKKHWKGESTWDQENPMVQKKINEFNNQRLKNGEPKLSPAEESEIAAIQENIDKIEHRREIKKQKSEGIIRRENANDFLVKHGLDKEFYWDGGDLIDAETDAALPVRLGWNGAQEDYLLDQINKLRKKPGKDLDEERSWGPDKIGKVKKVWGHEWTEDEDGDVIQVKTKSGKVIKLGDKDSTGDYVTGFDPETNSIYLDEDPNVDGGRDYAVEDVEDLFENLDEDINIERGGISQKPSRNPNSMFKNENDIAKLVKIYDKHAWSGESDDIDISNAALVRISELVPFTNKENDIIAGGTGEEIMDVLKSKIATPTQKPVDMNKARVENSSLYLLDQYKKGKMDYNNLYNELLKIHGNNPKSVFEWLLRNSK